MKFRLLKKILANFSYLKKIPESKISNPKGPISNICVLRMLELSPVALLRDSRGYFELR